MSNSNKKPVFSIQTRNNIILDMFLLISGFIFKASCYGSGHFRPAFVEITPTKLYKNGAQKAPFLHLVFLLGGGFFQHIFNFSPDAWDNEKNNQDQRTDRSQRKQRESTQLLGSNYGQWEANYHFQ